MDSAIILVSIAAWLRMAVCAALLLPPAVAHEPLQNQGSGGKNAALPAETPASAYSFVNSIGVNTHLNYFDLLYGNFGLVERELKSLAIPDDPLVVEISF